jgi:hypothetical protein
MAAGPADIAAQQRSIGTQGSTCEDGRHCLQLVCQQGANDCFGLSISVSRRQRQLVACMWLHSKQQGAQGLVFAYEGWQRQLT